MSFLMVPRAPITARTVVVVVVVVVIIITIIVTSYNSVVETAPMEQDQNSHSH